MRRLLAFLLLMLLMLTGCKKGAEKPLLPDDDYNIEGERTVLFCGKKTFPISFTTDGKQKIKNGTYLYYELSNQFQRDWEDSFYLYHPENLELMDYKESGTFEKMQAFATNGNWPLFLNPVHTEYSLSNQAQLEKGLVTAGSNLLKQQKMAKEPLIITDVWSCDMDQDGKEEHFFKASNYGLPEKEMKQEEMIEDEVCPYSFLAYLDDDNCQLLSGSFRKEMNEPENKDASTVLSVLTYNEENQLASSPLMRKKKEIFLQDLRPIIADPDGDKIWSVFVYRRGDFNSLTLMDFKNGSFIKQYEIVF